MLQSEFENLWGGCVTPSRYKDVIEPMYLALPEDMSKIDFVGMLEPPRADEYQAYRRDILYADKKRFVSNLGWLLSQTRLDIEGCTLVTISGEDYVFVQYMTGEMIKINVTADSYVAIIRDVCRRL